MSEHHIGQPTKDNVVIVTISGSIDDKVALLKISFPKEVHIIFNLKTVTMINSSGIRAWVQLMSTIARHQISYVNCQKAFIDQVNMVNGFTTPKSKVVSFFVPYYNEEEAVEKNVLFTFGKEFNQNTVNLPSEVLTDSGKPMELDVIDQKYFKFIFDNKN